MTPIKSLLSGERVRRSNLQPDHMIAPGGARHIARAHDVECCDILKIFGARLMKASKEARPTLSSDIRD